MTTAGVNVKSGTVWDTLTFMRSEQFSIPPASASIGGACYGLSRCANSVLAADIMTIDITVSQPLDAAYSEVAGVELKEAFESLRRQMVSEGIPFLDAAELESEIASRKGTRS